MIYHIRYALDLTRKNIFGIDAPETAQLINNKKKFRKIATNLGLPVPKIFSHDNLSAFWPVIVKPVDAYSGRGVTVVRESEQEKLPSAIQKAEKFSRTGTCVIEEYVEGQLYSHSAFIADRKILADFIVEEHSTANSFVVDTSRVIYDFPKEILLRIRKIIQLLASKLNLVDGLIHTQFIKNEDVFWLIEITRRCPGDLYSKLIESSTAFPYVESYVRPFLNQPVMFENSIKQTQYYVLRHTISQPSGNLFSSIRFNRSVEIENLIFLALSGDNVKESPFGRIALLFAKANSEEELCGLMDSALKRELYKINSNIF